MVTELRRAQLRAADARYRAANREKLNAKQREARAADPTKQAARMRDYRRRKPDVMRAIEARRVRPAEQREKFNRYRSEWRKANPDKVREHAEKRRCSGRLPPGTIKRIGEAQGWRCACCTVDLRTSGYHKDHIIPLSKGGPHAPENIQLLCPPCNLRKGAKLP